MGFEECGDSLRQWLSEAEMQLPSEIELHSTLDEKRAQLQIYRSLLHDATAHQQDIVSLRDKTENLPGATDAVKQELQQLVDRHAALLKRALGFVERYEGIVSDHQQYSKAVMETQEWLEATHNTVSLFLHVILYAYSLL